MLKEKLENPNVSPLYYIELGYNFQLQEQTDEAAKYYDKAIGKLQDIPTYAYLIGYTFQQKSLLDYAVRSYKEGLELAPSQNLHLNLARVYGEMGDIEEMFNTYLDLIVLNPESQRAVVSGIYPFLTMDYSGVNVSILRRQLIKRSQETADIVWNELLSWLFVQQQQYGQAFLQERAIYKRSGETTISRLEELAAVAMDGGDRDNARIIYEFIVANAYDPEPLINAKLKLLTLNLENVSPTVVERSYIEFKELYEQYGDSPFGWHLEIEYGNFLAYYKGDFASANRLLKAGIERVRPRRHQAQLKMTLAAILVFYEHFNEALIYYSQVQKDFKNDVLGQEARFKIAQTSFYKGDFRWAENQLDVLKSSTSQLIANDALQLKLLISDNSLQDSLKTALKLYAKADLLALQKKTDQAIAVLDEILANHKGESIEDEALFKQAQLFENQSKYDLAQSNYLKILEYFNGDILSDDALFHLAKLYEGELGEPNKALELYERILLGHPDSIFYVEARKNYRKLRGDDIN